MRTLFVIEYKLCILGSILLLKLSSTYYILVIGFKEGVKFTKANHEDININSFHS